MRWVNNLYLLQKQCLSVPPRNAKMALLWNKQVDDAATMSISDFTFWQKIETLLIKVECINTLFVLHYNIGYIAYSMISTCEIYKDCLEIILVECWSPYFMFQNCIRTVQRTSKREIHSLVYYRMIFYSVPNVFSQLFHHRMWYLATPPPCMPLSDIFLHITVSAWYRKDHPYIIA